MWLLWVTIVCVASSKATGKSVDVCSKTELNSCKKGIDRIVESGRFPDERSQEYQCWSVVEYLDCVVQHASCSGQNEQANMNSTANAEKYLDDFCQPIRDWKNRDCYRSRLNRCEGYLPESPSPNEETCEAFGRFKSCTTGILDKECDEKDKKLLALYLLNKGHRMIWTCPLGSALPSPAAFFLKSCNEENVADTMKPCLNNMLDSLRMESGDRDFSEDKPCCAWKRFRRCVLDGVRALCGDQAEKEAEELVRSQSQSVASRCEGKALYFPSSALSPQAPSVLAVALLALWSLTQR